MFFSTFIFINRSHTQKQTYNQKDFVLARHLIKDLLKGGEIPLESITSIEKIIVKHPELHPEYDGLLALAFFQKNNLERGKAYQEMQLARVENTITSPYQQFAKISLMITEGSYVEALTSTQELESILSIQTSLEPLRAYNLLRLAFLAKELKQENLESEAWGHFQKLPSFLQLSSFFQEGSFTLDSFFSSQT